MTGHDARYACAACKTEVKQSRWLGIWPRDRYFFQAIGPGFRNAEPDLSARPFTRAQLAALVGSCYRDADLEAIAAGDLSRLRPPGSTLARVLFPHSRETCHIQVNGLTRAEGPPLPDGVSKINNPVDRASLKMLDRGNLFISDQRMIFPSGTHTIIRIDHKLSGVCSFADALAIQRTGDDAATYFLGVEHREALLVAAYLQGRLNHLR